MFERATLQGQPVFFPIVIHDMLCYPAQADRQTDRSENIASICWRTQ